MGQDRERIRSMNSDSYRNAIAEYVHAEAKPADKFSHQPRLYQLAKLLAGDRPFDDDVLYAAAWLHDIGVFLGHRPEDPAALANWDNVAYAVKEVPKLLKQFAKGNARVIPPSDERRALKEGCGIEEYRRNNRADLEFEITPKA